MKSFTYQRALDPALAIEGVAKSGAKFISGGTNLLDLMKLGIETPTHLVDISRLPMRQIEETPDGGVRIGARRYRSQLRQGHDTWTPGQARVKAHCITQAVTLARP